MLDRKLAVDKTIPFKDIIMRNDNPQLYDPVLPEGYTLDTYKDGDEYAWAKMEVYAGDFATEEKAVQYFRDIHLCKKDEVMKRFVAVRNKDGLCVSSCFAWKTNRKGEPAAALQWLVTMPGYEGLGLARAAAAETVNRYYRMGEKPVYLHTQPWSYKALWLYYQHGFKIVRNDTFQAFGNDCDEALEILDKLIPADKMAQIRADVLDD